MAGPQLRVIFSRPALLDLAEIEDYWASHDEPERGERYARDLPAEALELLSDPAEARAGRHLRDKDNPGVQEILVFRRSYRIIYFVRTDEQLVEVLRFWHSHRDEPFQK
jgi:plasmid stabilization system protein ParE